MKILKFLMFFVLACSCHAAVLSADSAQAILKEFSISASDQNIQTLNSIASDIDENDVKLFRHIVTEQFQYAKMIMREIESNNSPEFMLYLAMVESNLQNGAVSPKSASGVWQFMPSTARVHGLKINDFVDERRDPFASTFAAHRYLKTMQDGFGKWYVTLMAYNCGDGRMRKAIRDLGTDDFSFLLSSNKFPKETKNFIQKIIKFAIIARTDEMQQRLNSSVNYTELAKIPVPASTTLENISAELGVSVADMKFYNPHINKGVAPNHEYYFYVPSQKAEMFAEVGKFGPGSKIVATNEKAKGVAIP